MKLTDRQKQMIIDTIKDKIPIWETIAETTYSSLSRYHYNQKISMAKEIIDIIEYDQEGEEE